MPRTKRPAKKPEKSQTEDDETKKLNKFIKDQKIKVDKLAEMEIRNIDIAFKIWLGSLSTTGYLQRTIGELKSELLLREGTRRATRQSSRSASHDDGYLTENSSQGSGERGTKKQFAVPAVPMSSSRCRRSRSADASTRKPPSTASRTTAHAHRRRSRSVYRTPAYNKNSNFNYPAITPKVVPDTPVTILRRPRQGEMVVSMSGSPVMVPTGYTGMAPTEDEVANCNIMLNDGTTLSLQPQQFRHSQTYIPFNLMDSKVLTQLKTLKDNLEKVVKLAFLVNTIEKKKNFQKVVEQKLFD